MARLDEVENVTMEVERVANQAAPCDIPMLLDMYRAADAICDILERRIKELDDVVVH